MKTAIFNTDFWKDDTIFSLNSDTRQLYLCLITNPERNTTPAYKCTDRLLSAFTGYSKELLEICKKQLHEKNLVFFIGDYIVLGKNAYIKPQKGKLTHQLYEKEFDKLPNDVKEFIDNLLLSHSGAVHEYIDINIDNNKKKPNREIEEIIKLFEEIDPKNKTYYNNKTERASADFLIQEYGKEMVEKVIALLPKTNQMPYMPSITKPSELKEKWNKLKDAFAKKQNEKLQANNKYQII